jgi:hypothetical protein
VRQAIVRGPQIGQWLAVDPGGMTGWVLFRPVVDTEQLAGIGLEKINRYRRENGAPNNVGKGGQGHAVQALRHALLFASTRWSPR